MLCDLGVRRIQTLQEMPPDLVEKVMGKNGRQIWEKAQGIDPSPVIPFHERKSISTERTFDQDTIDVHRLEGILTAMTENLAFQLRRAKKLTACIAVKIRYSDFDTQSLQNKISYTSADHLLIPRIREMFNKLYNRRLRVRLIGVRFSDLVGGAQQINLFEDTEERIRLYQAMDRIRIRYGDRAVVRASGMDAKTIGRSNPFNGEPPPLLANRRQ